MKSLLIVIPAYNEEKRIGRTLGEYGKYFTDVNNSTYLRCEILVVINNTTDRTNEIVQSMQRVYPIINFIDIPQGGKGLATIEGFNIGINNNFDYMGYVDADNATRPEEFYRLFENIGDNDGIIASRYLPGAIVNPKPTIQRIITSRVFNFLIRSFLFLNYHDTQCGAKILKREVIENILPKMTMSQWAFDVEILYLAKKLKFKIIEIPTVWSDQHYSKINFLKASPRMALSIVRLRIMNSIFRPFMRIYSLIGKDYHKF